VPWRGARERGEFPTLGWVVGAWIEAHLVVPSGPARGAEFLLTGEQWRHLLHAYRLRPDALVQPRYHRPVDGFVYYGSQLRRPQKWGKDPLGAARAIAHALGPAQFDGWDADGEPVGRAVGSPWVQVAGTSEDNTLNTWRPLVTMLREGPLIDTVGLDVGDTRIKLPAGEGWIEPVTSAATSRLGNPITFATFTEPHLYTERSGGLSMARAMKRNLGGTGGSWAELTNAWNPAENSAAQQQAEGRAPGVYLDHRAPDLARLTPAEFEDDNVVRERIVIKYGDSGRDRGGWVDPDHILALIRDPATGEAEARRFYLDEVTVGERDAVDGALWDALAVRPTPDDDDTRLQPGERVVLGFDGSRKRDATALIAVRIRDGRWFTLGIWVPTEQPGGVVHVDVVEAAFEAARAAYDVWHVFADPYRWEPLLDRLAGEWGNHATSNKPIIIEYPTNVDQRIDAAIRLFETVSKSGGKEFSHDGNKVLTQHAKNAAFENGKRKPEREDDDGRREEYYLKVVKKRRGWLIDSFVAGILGTAARGLAVEHGAMVVEDVVEPWVIFT
jgi:hypothetical protein